MIYDLLKAYKKYLLTLYRPSTAEGYYKKLCTLFQGQCITATVKRLDIDAALNKLSQIKDKRAFSQYKNAFLHFCEFQAIELPTNTLERINELGKATRKKRRKLGELDYIQVDKKIKFLRNKRLRLSYQVMAATGLRVSELASISSTGYSITDAAINFDFIARGGTSEVITIIKTSYPKLYKDLVLLIKSTSQTQDKDMKIFYSAGYLQKKAKSLGFACHDLRRVFAKLEFKKSRSKATLMKKLRHKSLKATRLYLRSKIKV